MKKILFPLVLLIFALVGCTKEKSPQMLIRVVLDGDMVPVQSARVSIYKNYENWLNSNDEIATGLTNSFGEIQFDNLSNIKYYIHVKYVDEQQTAYVNFPYGIYASSELQSGQRAVLTIGVYDVDTILEDDHNEQDDQDDYDDGYPDEEIQ